MRGYLDDPELTAETIRDGWLHTGDLGWFDASRHLHLCGRIKDLMSAPVARTCTRKTSSSRLPASRWRSWP